MKARRSAKIRYCIVTKETTSDLETGNTSIKVFTYAAASGSPRATSSSFFNMMQWWSTVYKNNKYFYEMRKSLVFCVKMNLKR